MKYPDDLTQEALLEVLEWQSRPPDRVKGPFGDLVSNAEAVERWDQRHSEMSDDELRAELPEREPEARLARMEAWTGEEFVAISVGWPLKLGSFLAAEGRETIGDGPFWDGIENPAHDTLFHVVRSKSHGLSNSHTPTEWLNWAQERGLELPFERDASESHRSKPSDEKPLSTQERKTLLAIIYVMSTGQYKWKPDANSEVPKLLERSMVDKAHSVSAETIRKKLRQAHSLMRGHGD